MAKPPGRRANARTATPPNAQRDADILAMRAAGFTLSVIAGRYRLTDARVWQIVRGWDRPHRDLVR